MGDGIFDRLVKDLPLNERQQLLERISSSTSMDAGPLIHEEDYGEVFDPAALLSAKPWYVRLYYHIRSIFASKSPKDLFEESLYARLAGSINASCPASFDYHRGELLAPFRDALASLRDSARFFYEAFDGSLVRDKAAFIVFLGSLNMDWIHRRILDEADPFVIGAANSSLPGADIRQLSSRALETILQGIGDEERAIMYHDIRTLTCLKELSSFLFDRLIGAFDAGDHVGCPVYIIADQLLTLSNLLASLPRPPSLQVIESLFVFNHQDDLHREKYDLDGELAEWVKRAQTALERIRQFNRLVPLPAIVRCAKKDLSWMPAPVSAGEDWFTLYRDFWRREMEEKYTAFIRERRREELEESINGLFKGHTRPVFRAEQSSKTGETLPFAYGASLSFLLSFHQCLLMPRLNRFLKLLLVEGDFRRRENRVEYTEAYNCLVNLNKDITAFDQRIAPTGEWGALYTMTQTELVSLPVKRRKLQGLSREVDAAAREIIQGAFKGLRSMLSLLPPILGRPQSAKYDGLTNLDALAPKGSAFLEGLALALQSIDKTVQILSDVESLDSGR